MLQTTLMLLIEAEQISICQWQVCFAKYSQHGLHELSQKGFSLCNASWPREDPLGVGF